MRQSTRHGMRHGDTAAPIRDVHAVIPLYFERITKLTLQIGQIDHDCARDLRLRENYVANLRHGNYSKGQTQKVWRLLVHAREDGIIPWEWIVDETREPERVSSWSNLSIWRGGSKFLPEKLLGSSSRQGRGLV